jgi:hypothetical protein
LAEYRLASIWQLQARMEPVWAAIHQVDAWPEWWPSVVSVMELERGDAQGAGAVRRFIWRGRLPLRLAFDVEVTRVERPFLIEGRARGDLEGVGVWHLQAVDGATRARYDWTVAITRTWMNVVAPLARPLFAWNHHAMMRAGGEGLARRLGARLIYAGPERR